MNIMLAREPIFDHQEKVIGFQILHHDRDAETSDHAALEALLESGVDRLTNGSIAFLNVTREMLLTGSVELLDRRGVVMVMDGSERDPDAVARCQQYAELGYHLAVDIDVDTPPNPELLDLAEVARVDLRQASVDGLRLLAQELRARRLQLVAVGVSNARLRDDCARLGFRMFQGYRFNQPEVISQRDLAVEHLRAFRLLKDLRNPDIDDAQIIEAFHRDPNLTYRFLRMVNSAAVGGVEVSSISYAIRLMGREALSRWLSLLLLLPFSSGGLSAEIASSAVVRARHCELLAELVGRPWAADTLFTLGLFSRLDLLLGTSIENIVEQIPFAEELRVALLSREGPDGEVLALVEAYEAGRWDEMESRAAALQVPVDELGRLYLEALPWGNQRLSEETIAIPANAGRPEVRAPAAAQPRRERSLGALLTRVRSVFTWRPRRRALS